MDKQDKLDKQDRPDKQAKSDRQDNLDSRPHTLISVIIPTHNRQALTDRAVDSVIASQPELFEIIVIDDCGSIPYAYPQAVNPNGITVQAIRTATNVGPGLARKLGVEQARGSVVAFLDSDDLFATGWPDALLAEICRLKTPHGLFITGRTHGAAPAQHWATLLCGRLRHPSNAIYARLIAIAFNPFYTPATAISKQICSFSDAIRYCEDYFTNTAALFQARRISVLSVPACTISRRPGSEGGRSEFRKQMRRGEFAVRKQMLSFPFIPYAYRTLVPLGMAYAVVRDGIKSMRNSVFTSHLPSVQSEPEPSRIARLVDSSRDKPRSARIAILGCRGIPAEYGGFETFAEKLSAGLAQHGLAVTVYCEGKVLGGPFALHQVTLRYHSAPALGPLSTIVYDAKCLWSARKDFDLVYMLGYGASPFCILPRLWGTRVWINPDGLEWARAKWGRIAQLYFRWMEWVSVRVANRIVADAEAIAASLASRHRRMMPACTVIPYGCDVIDTPPSLIPLARWNLVPGEYFLIVARLEPENHVLEMLHAFKQSGSGRQLIVVGNHLASARYVAHLRAISDPRIRMIGAVYEQAVLTSLRYHCFAYLHGHSVGGTNPSLLEAMGCGNLIAAHDNPFNRETLGEDGFFFRNTEGLKEILDRLELDTSTVSEKRSGAQLRAADRYRWASVIDRYLCLIKTECSAIFSPTEIASRDKMEQKAPDISPSSTLAVKRRSSSMMPSSPIPTSQPISPTPPP